MGRGPDGPDTDQGRGAGNRHVPGRENHRTSLYHQRSVHVTWKCFAFFMREKEKKKEP